MTVRAYLALKSVLYVVDEAEEENVEGYYETPYSSLRDRDDATARFIISTALMPEQMWLVMDQKTARKA